MPHLFVKSDDCQQISAKTHNRKCTLLSRLERAKTPTKLLFVKFKAVLLSGVPDYFGRNKISSGGDLSHYSSASLY